MKKPNLSFYTIATVFGLLAVGSLLAHANITPVVQATVLVIWFVGPPIYFFFEFHRARSQGATPIVLDEIKDSQALAAKVWVGVSAALAVLYCRNPWEVAPW